MGLLIKVWLQFGIQKSPQRALQSVTGTSLGLSHFGWSLWLTSQWTKQALGRPLRVNIPKMNLFFSFFFRDLVTSLFPVLVENITKQSIT